MDSPVNGDVQVAQNLDNFGKRIAAWSGPNMTGIGVYDFGGVQIIVNTGQPNVD
jgi:hypothetical protein